MQRDALFDSRDLFDAARNDGDPTLRGNYFLLAGSGGALADAGLAVLAHAALSVEPDFDRYADTANAFYEGCRVDRRVRAEAPGSRISHLFQTNSPGATGSTRSQPPCSLAMNEVSTTTATRAAPDRRQWGGAEMIAPASGVILLSCERRTTQYRLDSHRRLEMPIGGSPRADPHQRLYIRSKAASSSAREALSIDALVP